MQYIIKLQNTTIYKEKMCLTPIHKLLANSSQISLYIQSSFPCISAEKYVSPSEGWLISIYIHRKDLGQPWCATVQYKHICVFIHVYI